jgi:hypothetical protein
MKQFVLILVCITALTGFEFLSNTSQDEVYLFSYFKGNGEDGLHLAYSEDGLHWKALHDDQSFLTPEVGHDKLMRDPCIISGPDGIFHMVWTVSWGEKGIGYARSKDLIHWSEQQFIPVMAHEPDALNCWAPEIYYDDIQDRYMIYWSTTIPGRFPETEGKGDEKYNHRMYYTTTQDFNTFTPTSLLYNQGFNVIDGTIIRQGKQYYMFLKDETRYPPEKNIRIATSEKLTGPYSKPSPPITGDYWAEGPTTVRAGNRWIVYFDKYTNHQMGAVASDDLKNWQDISHQIQFPKGTRHGSVFKVPRRVLDKLLEQ